MHDPSYIASFTYKTVVHLRWTIDFICLFSTSFPSLLLSPPHLFLRLWSQSLLCSLLQPRILLRFAHHSTDHFEFRPREPNTFRLVEWPLDILDHVRYKIKSSVLLSKLRPSYFFYTYLIWILYYTWISHEASNSLKNIVYYIFCTTMP